MSQRGWSSAPPALHRLHALNPTLYQCYTRAQGGSSYLDSPPSSTPLTNHNVPPLPESRRYSLPPLPSFTPPPQPSQISQPQLLSQPPPHLSQQPPPHLSQQPPPHLSQPRATAPTQPAPPSGNWLTQLSQQKQAAEPAASASATVVGRETSKRKETGKRKLA